jgi:ABC-type sugar transport system permease subunit
MFKQVTAGQFGYASAIGVILFAIIIVATVINMRFRRQTESM